MSHSDSVDQRSILILDTGPIRELVTYRAVNDLGFMNLRHQLKHLSSIQAYQNCGRFLSSFRRKMTSASVIAELNCWIRGTRRAGQRQIWQLVHDEFNNMGMEEDIVRFLEMSLDLVTSHGPVDASLVEIARRNLVRNPTVITIDDRLRAECKKVGYFRIIPARSLPKRLVIFTRCVACRDWIRISEGATSVA